MARTKSRKAQFSRNRQPFNCQHCARPTTGPADDLGSRLCPECYEAAGLENEHSDNGHAEFVPDCPTCKAELRAKGWVLTEDEPAPPAAKPDYGAQWVMKDECDGAQEPEDDAPDAGYMADLQQQVDDMQAFLATPDGTMLYALRDRTVSTFVRNDEGVLAAMKLAKDAACCIGGGGGYDDKRWPIMATASLSHDGTAFVLRAQDMERGKEYRVERVVQPAAWVVALGGMIDAMVQVCGEGALATLSPQHVNPLLQALVCWQSEVR